jgi:gas vesicle protein
MNLKDLIGGLLAGAAIGVAVGLLLAPKSGKQTREDLLNGSRKLSDSLMGTVDESLEALKGKFNSNVDELARKGRETVTNLGEKVRSDGKI